MFSRIRVWRAGRLFRSGHEAKQLRAVELLRTVRGESADRLLLTAITSPYLAVTLVAVDAIRDRNAISWMPTLLDLLRHQEAKVREAARAALSDLEPDWIRSRAATDAFDRFGCQHPDSLTQLVEDALSSVQSPSQRKGTPENREQRTQASELAQKLLPRLLGRNALPTAMKSLRTARAARMPELWHMAERWIMTSESRSCAELLSIGLNRELEPGIREVVILGAGSQGPEKDTVLQSLLSVARDKTDDLLVRCSAIRALGRCRAVGLGSELLSLLEEHVALAEATAEALGDIGYRDAIGTLLRVMERYTTGAGTRYLPIVCFKTIARLDGIEQFSTLLSEQSRYEFLFPYLADIDSELARRGTALDGKFQLARRTLSSRQSLRTDEIINRIHEVGKNASDLNIIAVADWTRIALADQQQDPSHFLACYAKRSYYRRQHEINIDVATLAQLWNVGRYWRSCAR